MKPSEKYLKLIKKGASSRLLCWSLTRPAPLLETSALRRSWACLLDTLAHTRSNYTEWLERTFAPATAADTQRQGALLTPSDLAGQCWPAPAPSLPPSLLLHFAPDALSLR